MAMWASQPTMHPWFSLHSLKRKHSESESDSDQDPLALHTISSPPLSAQSSLDAALTPTHSYGHQTHREWPTPTPKRRRCAIIENGLAGLKLDSNGSAGIVYPVQKYAQVHSPPHSPSPGPSQLYADAPTIERLASTDYHGNPYHGRASADLDIDIDIPFSDVFVQPGSVEEPVSPEMPAQEVHEIKMRGTSSYEPQKDRIIITDLDSESDEDEYKQEIELHPSSSDYSDSNADLSISSALLRHLKQSSALPLPDTDIAEIMKKDAAASMALVLFKPAPFDIGTAGAGGKAEEKERSAPETVVMLTDAVVDDDDAMDIEL